MIWPLLISAVGLLFVLEGIMPFLSPAFWRGIMQHMSIRSDRSLRIMGLISMLVGLTLVVVARDLFT